MTELRKCFREPIPEIFEAARLLRSAVDAHLAGDKTSAARFFAAANMPTVRQWTESIWGSRIPFVGEPRIVEGSPSTEPRSSRQKDREPSSGVKKAAILRDGFHCRFCGTPVVQKHVRIKAQKHYPEAIPWGDTNASQHAGFQALWLQFDHLVPHSRGGKNDTSNILVTCAPCNNGRGGKTIDEFGLLNPLQHPPMRSTWNGLEDFI